MHYICEWTYEGDRKALKRVMVDVFPYVSWTVYVCILMSGRDKRQFRWHRIDYQSLSYGFKDKDFF